MPSPPGVALRVLELTQHEDASLGDIADTISSDPALAAKLLKFANSPMAGVAQSVSSVHQAISLIGLRAVKLMALSFSLIANDDASACAGFDFDRFWSRSLARAVAAQVIARESRAHGAEEAFVAGLLSGIGQLAVATGAPADYARVLEQARQTDEPLAVVERDTLGTTCPEVGDQLLRHWKLPDTLCEAAAASQKLSPEDAYNAASPLPGILLMADQTASVICGAEGERGADFDELCAVAQRVFDWNTDSWGRIFEQISGHWQEFGRILSIKTGEVKSFADIRAEAQEYIAELSLAAQMKTLQVEARNDELLKRATTDQLTGAGNRAAFDERLELEHDRAERLGRPLALALLDIDRFKNFNDTYGHQAGDEVLQVVARTLRATARKVDFVARYGGEEFGVIAPECTPAGAAALGERLRQEVEAAEASFNGLTLQVTVSVGVVVYATPDGSRSRSDLIRAADRLLYRAKDAGRNAVKIAAFRPAEVGATS